MKRATWIPFLLLVILAFAALFAPRSAAQVPTGGPIIQAMWPGCSPRRRWCC